MLNDGTSAQRVAHMDVGDSARRASPDRKERVRLLSGQLKEGENSPSGQVGSDICLLNLGMACTTPSKAFICGTFIWRSAALQILATARYCCGLRLASHPAPQRPLAAQGYSGHPLISLPTVSQKVHRSTDSCQGKCAAACLSR